MTPPTSLEILVLDDEPFMLKLLATMLKRLCDADVTMALTGVAALEALAGATPPNLILCDLNMPDMDGIEFIRKLAERDYSGSLILVSGVDTRVLQAAERLAQAHHITLLGQLRKPVLPNELAALLQGWREPGQQWMTASAAAYTAEDVRFGIANGELVNHYQPKVSLATGHVVGVETLVRWAHPQDGLVYPDKFLDIAEDNGMIDALTSAVFAAALTQARQWRDAGLALSVAVNISMGSLSSLDFLTFITHSTSMSGVKPRDIILEVTESRRMQDLRMPLEILARLRLRGFRLAIDDFGTGHSSLAQLRDFPFDELKIDRGFVHGAAKHATARALYQASIGLAKQLGLLSVAEGVEDQDDWDFLKNTGCDLAQGYYIAKPMLAAELPGWIAQWNTRQKVWA